jgi:hypothetical protein
MGEVDLKKLLQRAIELVMPNLRHYYRLLRKGRVVKAYASDGSYWADVQLLRNDESDDANEPVITKIEIPVLWGGPERGIVCPPAVGTLCDIEYYDGDPNYARISNFRWEKNKAPICAEGGFIIQQSPDVYFLITPAGKLEIKSANAKMDMVTLDIVAAVTITGPLVVTGTIASAATVADATGTMTAMRDIFNAHTHVEHGSGGGVTDPPAAGM